MFPCIGSYSLGFWASDFLAGGCINNLYGLLGLNRFLSSWAIMVLSSLFWANTFRKLVCVVLSSASNLRSSSSNSCICFSHLSIPWCKCSDWCKFNSKFLTAICKAFCGFGSRAALRFASNWENENILSNFQWTTWNVLTFLSMILCLTTLLQNGHWPLCLVTFI